MEIHLRDSLHERISEKVGDDTDPSFLSSCREASGNSVLRGVQSIGDTMFDELQCRRLVAQLDRVPDQDRTPVVRRVAGMARQAVSCRGYLYISGG